jgi:hypothetical protein
LYRIIFIIQGILRAKSDSSASLHYNRKLMALLYFVMREWLEAPDFGETGEFGPWACKPLGNHTDTNNVIF